MDYKDVMKIVSIITHGPGYSVNTPGGSRPANLCSSCGEDIIANNQSFMLEWDLGGGMCQKCVLGYRSKVNYYSEKQIEKRNRSYKQFYFSKKQIAIRKKSNS